jgi:hypothetical protein
MMALFPFVALLFAACGLVLLIALISGTAKNTAGI